mmetsp:Transcript_39785/g.112895  ORF Transcript_39785/g.112895 Transcript_39785/m.112895 type:complete len:837 (-) Transcript_39785:266-2776(-)|eukprot:CAMPEP_0117677062 /NCGR_PEP_ID=MMETSP0804-20121206/16541_1 /TAXON_ID=1074897 /ORGANISM="Tetraselmis astigmatica, Strain CCMP880" /LENGTH=836 /DNA_ID=CAMNT_0005486313 /DNA_START=182 /DNA_END=2692 /DNA_ORIENTATION=+
MLAARHLSVRCAGDVAELRNRSVVFRRPRPAGVPVVRAEGDRRSEQQRPLHDGCRGDGANDRRPAELGSLSRRKGLVSCLVLSFGFMGVPLRRAAAVEDATLLSPQLLPSGEEQQEEAAAPLATGLEVDGTLAAGGAAAVSGLVAALFTGMQKQRSEAALNAEIERLSGERDTSSVSLKREQHMVAEIAEKLSAAQGKLAETKKLLDSSLADKDALQKQVEALQSSKERAEVLRGDLESTSDQLAAKSQTCEELANDVEDLNCAMARIEQDMQKTVKEYEETIRKERSLRGKARAEEAALQRSLEATTKELEATRSELEETFNTLSATTQELSNTRSKLEDSKASQAVFRKDLDGTKKRLAEALENLTETEDAVVSTQAALDIASTALEATMEDLDLAREQLEQFRGECKELGGELETARAELAEALDSLAATQAKVEELTEELEAKGRKLAGVAEELDVALRDNSRIEPLESRCAELEASWTEAVEKVAELQDSRDTLQAEVQNRQELIDSLRLEVSTRASELESVQKQLEEQTASLMRVQSSVKTIDALQKQLEEEKATSSSLRASLESAKTTLEIKEAALEHEIEMIRDIRTKANTAPLPSTQISEEEAAAHAQLDAQLTHIEGILGQLRESAEQKEAVLQAALDVADRGDPASNGDEVPHQLSKESLAAQQRENQQLLKKRLAEAEAALAAAEDEATFAREMLAAEREAVAVLEEARNDAMEDVQSAMKEVQKVMLKMRDTESQLLQERTRSARLEAELGESRDSSSEMQKQLSLISADPSRESDTKLLVELAGAKDELQKVKKSSRVEIAMLAAELSELKQKMAAMKQGTM